MLFYGANLLTSVKLSQFVGTKTLTMRNKVEAVTSKGQR
jgi:hypothetical protein